MIGFVALGLDVELRLQSPSGGGMRGPPFERGAGVDMAEAANKRFLRGMAVATFVLLIGLAGCSACRESSMREPGDLAYDVLLASVAARTPTGGHSSATIFDARPGPYHAEEFTARSDWPSTDAYYSQGQAVYFRERQYIYQGRQLGRWNPTYRRVDAVTYGAGYRP